MKLMRQHKFELQTPTFLQWNTASRIHPDDLKSLACLYCVMCGVISYELSAPQKYSSTHFSAVRAGQRPGRCVRRWNLISHYTQHKRNIKTIFCPGWAELCWAGLARLGENSEMGLVSEWFSALTQECESLTWNNQLILPSHVDEIIYY